MHTIAAAGAGFLIAVLWFDLMFDVQARGRGPVASEAALASISAYYRRVTTEASPMGRLISLVMLVTVAAIVIEIVRCEGPRWASGASLAAALVGMGLALFRTVRNAIRLGAASDPPEVRTTLARRILADHLISLAAMTTVLGLQIAT
jgi:ER membrane protein SH3